MSYERAPGRPDLRLGSLPVNSPGLCFSYVSSFPSADWYYCTGAISQKAVKLLRGLLLAREGGCLIVGGLRAKVLGISILLRKTVDCVGCVKASLGVRGGGQWKRSNPAVKPSGQTQRSAGGYRVCLFLASVERDSLAIGKQRYHRRTPAFSGSSKRCCGFMMLFFVKGSGKSTGQNRGFLLCLVPGSIFGGDAFFSGDIFRGSAWFLRLGNAPGSCEVVLVKFFTAAESCATIISSCFPPPQKRGCGCERVPMASVSPSHVSLKWLVLGMW